MAESDIKADKTAEPRSQALDGYRTLAIFIVMLNHCQGSLGYPGWMTPLSAILRGGVTAFMVLSGYLITLSLLRAEARTGKMGGWSFLRVQAVRFYPPVIFYLAVIIVLFWNRPWFYPDRALKVLWMDPFTGKGVVGTGHLYSLAAQLQFCLWWPLLLRWTPARRRLAMTTVLAFLLVAWRILGRELAIRHNGTFLRTDFVYGSLLVGCWWALMATEKRLEWVLRLRGLRLIPVFCLALLVVLVTRSPSAALGFVSDDLKSLVQPWRESFPVVLGIRTLAALGGMMAFGCLAFLLHRGRPAGVAKIFAWAPVAWVGKISFSVYLWQNIFCFGRTGTIADHFPLNVAASILAGWVAYRCVELPSLSWRSRLKHSTTVPARAAGSAECAPRNSGPLP